MIEQIKKELADLDAQGLYRRLRTIRGQGPRVTLDGRSLLLFCSNNYLGLAEHPSLKEAAVRAVQEHGVSSAASRLVSGTLELHEILESRVARFKGTEAALVFNSGYAANTGIISALVGRGDAIFCDRLNHASIIDGCLLSRADLIRYPHNDMQTLRRLLSERKPGGRRLIVTDGVFSMDGDIAPLKELVALKKEFGALLMVDDAHGSGVLGPLGRGTAELLRVMEDVDIHMGTLGKAFGSFGAYAAASSDLVSYLINKARSFIFSTSLPPAVLAASIAALDVVESAEGERLRTELERKSTLFRGGLQQAGFNTMGSETQIIPALVGDPHKTMQFSQMLLEHGIFLQGIRPPTVPQSTSRLRCTIMATHSDADLAEATEAIISIGRKLEVI